MKKRSPARELLQLATVWALCYVGTGLLTWGAIDSGKGAKLCFYIFFWLTPFMVLFGYFTLRDAWRDVPMHESDGKMALPALIFMAACYLFYRFVV